MFDCFVLVFFWQLSEFKARMIEAKNDLERQLQEAKKVCQFAVYFKFVHAPAGCVVILYISMLNDFRQSLPRQGTAPRSMLALIARSQLQLWLTTRSEGTGESMLTFTWPKLFGWDCRSLNCMSVCFYIIKALKSHGRRHVVFTLSGARTLLK